MLLPVPSSGTLVPNALPLHYPTAPSALMSVQTMPASLTSAAAQTYPIALVTTAATPESGSLQSTNPFSSLTATPIESVAVSLSKIAPLRYLAPEILATSSAHAFTFKSDVYAFGIVVYELLAMGNPFPGLMPEQVVMAVCTNREKPDMGAIRRDWPRELREMVENCLGMKPFSSHARLSG